MLHRGALSCHGRSMPMTLCSPLPQASPFQCQFRFRPPLFPEYEDDIVVPSVQHYMRRCRRTWIRVHKALLRTSRANQYQANWHQSSSPPFQPGFGFPHGISLSGWSPASLPPSILALLRWFAGSILLPNSSSCPVR